MRQAVMLARVDHQCCRQAQAGRRQARARRPVERVERGPVLPGLVERRLELQPRVPVEPGLARAARPARRLGPGLRLVASAEPGLVELGLVETQHQAAQTLVGLVAIRPWRPVTVVTRRLAQATAERVAQFRLSQALAGHQRAGRLALTVS